MPSDIFANPPAISAPIDPSADSRIHKWEIKRALDLMLAIVLLPLIAPVVAVLWILVRWDGGPGFFLHQRIARGGRPFWCIKLRSMAPDADLRLKALLAHNAVARAEWDRDAKLRDDPRVTRLGKFIRKTSLDELPQVINVLRGEMSFVGPRPIIESELQKYAEYKHAYLTLKPGVTGVWQVSGRNDVDYAKRIAIDVDYCKSRNLFRDFAIMVRTIGVVWRKTGL